MKTDKLEQFIIANQKAFDVSKPDPAIWERVEKRRRPVLSIGWKGIAWRAAVVVMIFGLSWVLNDITDKKNKQFSSGTSIEIAAEKSPMMEALFEAEFYYSSQINNKKELIIRLTQNRPEILQEIDLEFVELDNIYKELKEDLKDNADNEEVIEAMILNYRLKLGLLEEMLNLIKQSDNTEKNDTYENSEFQI